MIIFLSTIDFLLSKGKFWFALMIVTVIVSVKIYQRRIGERRGPSTMWIISTFIAVIVASVIFVAFTNAIVNSPIPRPARVDISPLALLNDEQIVHIENTIMQLVDNGSLRMSNFREFPEEHS